MSWTLRQSPVINIDLDERMPALVQRFLLSRGINSKDTLDEVTKLNLSGLQSPLSIHGMQKACNRLKEAFLKQEKICLYGDFDLDGTSGLAMCVSAFRELGFQNILHMQAKRLSEGYGFHPHLVEKAVSEGCTLFVTIDVGITAIDGCAKARELGVDVIITDHHLPAAKLPDAFVIVNPNQKDCTSNLKYLCGAGVAFYLLRALKRNLVDENLIAEETLDLKKCLDCFAIATITDLVPLVDDNRVLTKIGLRVLSETTREGLRALLVELGLFGRQLTSNDVGIRFAPKLNALSRLEGEILPIDVYLQESSTQAAIVVSKVISANQNRVQLQGNAEAELFENLKSWPYKSFVFCSSPNFHKGVIGLLATKVTGEKSLPAFIGYESSNGNIIGSARLPEGDTRHLLEALHACNDILIRFGGHRQAAGFELKKENAEKFKENLNHFFSNTVSHISSTAYDCQADLSEVKPEVMTWFEALGPFGQGFPQPLFLMGPLKITKSVTLKGGHLKLTLSNENGKNQQQFLWFSPPAGLNIELGSLCLALVELQWNYFDGMRTVQVLIKDFINEGDPRWQNMSSFLAQGLIPQSTSTKPESTDKLSSL